MGSHALLQGIFPTQGSNPGLPNYRQILYYLSHQGSPKFVLKYLIFFGVVINDILFNFAFHTFIVSIA